MPDRNATSFAENRTPSNSQPKVTKINSGDVCAGLIGKEMLALTSPAIYYVDRCPTDEEFHRAVALGFNAIAMPQLSDDVIKQASITAATINLVLIIDLDLTVPRDDFDIVNKYPEWFVSSPEGLRFIYQSENDAAVDWWDQHIKAMQQFGINNFRCLGIATILPNIWKRLIALAKQREPDSLFYGWTPGIPFEAISSLTEVGFDYSFSSSCWWDFRSGWLNDDAQRMSLIAPSISLATPPNSSWPSDRTHRSRALTLAAFYGTGWLMPAGFETYGDGELTEHIIRLNKIRNENICLQNGPNASVISSDGAQVAVMVRGGQLALVANSSVIQPAELRLQAIAARLSGRLQLLSDRSEIFNDIRLPPAAANIYILEEQSLIMCPASAPVDCDAPRIAIEAIAPKVDDGRFPVRRIVGDELTIEADLIADGHDKIAAEIIWRSADELNWQREPMTLVTNDRWRGKFTLSRIGRYVYKVVAWKDFYASFVDEITKKYDAGVSIHLELQEGIGYVREAFQQGPEVAREGLSVILRKTNVADDDQLLRMLVSEDVVRQMKSADLRKFEIMSPEILVDAERQSARFSSWYEIFPRSQSGDGLQHGTFADVVEQLPRIAAMGFDVLYFPPIHPIGRINRKGKNNTLTPAVDDPGSPYAIGAAEGGHNAVHPQLGDVTAFKSLVAEAAKFNIEIALDFAIQCAPDHPWLSEHKEWFDWRPDGSLRYAENPPKKYEDIVNVDFYADGAKPSLWIALRDVVQLWVDRGVRLFRVDNPHTKPLPFWEWLIRDIRSRHPDAIFLAEAFTRPKLMYRLAKIGFSQSYTYFTWRHTKAEITEYMMELNETPQREFFGPHFFVNTPDINPIFLQQSGRSGFLIRAALASTLSGLWGVYNGFELCDAKPLTPGKEEYLDSEKYQIRAWDYNQPGNIVAEITKLNSIRRRNAALHTHLGIEFHTALDDDVLYFSKYAEDGNRILVAICLDPFKVHEFTIEVPLWLLGLADDASMAVTDLMRDYDFVWHGKSQNVILHPDSPFCIWRIWSEGQ